MSLPPTYSRRKREAEKTGDDVYEHGAGLTPVPFRRIWQVFNCTNSSRNSFSS
jgi:hypothetical protein